MILESMKYKIKYFKNISKTSFFAILILLLIYFIKNSLNDFKSIQFISPSLIVLFTFLYIFNYFLIGVITRILLGPLNVNLSTKESFAISIVTGFYNIITPFRGGIAARAFYLKKKHNFPYNDFLASLWASYILIFLVASFLGILSTILIYFTDQVFSWILFSIFSIFLLVLLFIIIFSPQLKERNNKFLNKFIKVVNGWHLIKNNKKVIFSIIILSVIQLAISALMLFLQFKVFGIEVSYIKSLFLTSISSLGIIISITPANLGIQEAITVFSALTIGITPAQSLSAALLGRAISLIVLFILGPIFSYLLIKKSKLFY